MRCPACGSDTAAGMPRCVRCNADLRADLSGQVVDQVPYSRPAPVPRRRGVPGHVGWVVSALLAAVAAGAVVVLWPQAERTGQPAAGAPPHTRAPAPDTTSPAAPTAATPGPEAVPVQRRYWVDTFADADGYREPAVSGEPAGRLREGTHYVFCKRRGARVERPGRADVHNHWWLLTDLDRVYGRGGSRRAWVAALWLTHWGNDEAKDNAGRQIPTCPS